MARSLLDIQCLRKTIPRAGPLCVLYAKQMDFQYVFAPLLSVKYSHEAVQKKASCHFDLWGLDGLPGSPQQEDPGSKGYHKP